MAKKSKKKFLALRMQSPVVGSIYRFLRSAFIKVTSIVPDKTYAKLFYRLYTKQKLNLNNPTLTNEKMWWLKLNNRNPLMTICSDKHLARGYVEECGYSEILIPQIGAVDNVNDIDFSKFNIPVILKNNNSSGDYIFYNPEDKDFNEKSAKRQLKKGLKQKYYLVSREWNYKHIPPKVVIEEVIKTPNGEPLRDFRFFCFDGEPKLLMMDVGVLNDDGVYQANYPRNIYDMDFNLLSIKWGRDPYKGHVDKPKNFEKMIEISRKLSQPFPMCRVDLYNVEGKIYFGEITFYHGGCCQKIAPEEWDRKIASWIDLNNPKIVLKTKKKK